MKRKAGKLSLTGGGSTFGGITKAKPPGEWSRVLVKQD
jgi:hypothetical protein